MTTLAQELQSLSHSNYIELFQIDTTAIASGGSVYYVTPNTISDTEVVWQGNTYIPFPIMAEGFEQESTDGSSQRPTLTISNVLKYLQTEVVGIEDLVGAKFTRYRTFKRFLDGESDADPDEYLGPELYYVSQKTGHTKATIQWDLQSALDKPQVKLPKRQVLRDGGAGGLAFPGVSVLFGER